MNTNRVRKNIVTSLLQQVVSVACAFILPRLILSAYGSAHNGIVSSVSQFISYITLLRAGIGGVTRAALYKSLAAEDWEETGAILKATERFMRKIALIFSVLLVAFAAIYPFFVKEEFDWFFSFSMVLVLGISTVVQYYFGITNLFLLHADQKLYVYNVWQIVATILNTVLSVLLIQAGQDIRIVKLGSAIAFSITPIMLYCYAKRRYPIPRKIAPNNSAIAQRWDAFAHQIAAFVHGNTDVVILTFFANLKQVSVYTVYHMVVSGVNMLITTMASAVEARLGNIIARDNKTLLNQEFATYEMVLHLICTVLFACTATLIVPFVMLYTAGVVDDNYHQPALGICMCLAYWISAIRLPYQKVIEAAGQFKETKKYAVIEAILNVCVSCVLVIAWGTVGVVVGTIIAMGYRTVCYMAYVTKHIIQQPWKKLVKRVAISAASMGITILLCDRMLGEIPSFSKWVLAGFIVAAVSACITLTINFIFYPREIIRLIRRRPDIA